MKATSVNRRVNHSVSTKGMACVVAAGLCLLTVLVPSPARAEATARLQLDWDDNTEPDMDHYNVYRTETPGSSYAKVNAEPVTPSEYLDTGLAWGVTYYYVVTAVDDSLNESPYSAEVGCETTDASAPTTPADLAASVVSSSRIDLTWSASTDNDAVVAYRVYRDGVQVAEVTGTAYQDTGLSSAQSYAYQVSACDAAGNESARSGEVSATTIDDAPPTTPADLAASVASPSQIDLTWSASTDNDAVAGYRVYRDGLQVAEVTGTAYQDTGLSSAQSYVYQVSAYDAAGNESARSGEVSGTTVDESAPTTPADLKATAVSSSLVDLSWNPSTDDEGVAGYRVYRNGVRIVSVTATTFQDTGLSSAQSYTYQVSAYDAAGNESALSPGVTCKTPDDVAPTSPQDLDAIVISSSRIDLSWGDSTDNESVAGYRVYRDGALIASVAGTTLQDSGLSAEQSYVYQVSAYDGADNESALSGDRRATASDLAAHWTFNDGGGDIAIDSSPHGHDAYLANGPVWTEGRHGGALLFDGADAVVHAGSPGEIEQLSDAMAVSLWTRVAEADLEQSLLEKVQADRGFSLRVLPGGTVLFSVSDGASMYTAATSEGFLSNGQWQNVVVTLQGRSGLEVFVNGALAPVVETGSLAGLGDIRTAGETLIGNSQSPGKGFNGAIDDVRLYNRALDAMEIAALYDPEAPGGLAAVAGDSCVQLAWDQNPERDVVSYRVLRATTPGGPRVEVATPTEPTCTDAGLTNDTTYYYVVEAVDMAGRTSPPSEEVAARPTDMTPPAVPAALNSVVSDGVIYLDWPDNTESDFSHYDVYRSTTSGGPYTHLNTAPCTASHYEDATLTESTPFYYVIRAVDDKGNASAYSPEASATLMAAPTALTATGADNSIVLDWDDNVEWNFDYYNVYRATSSGGPYERLNTSPLRSSVYTDTNVSSKRIYYYVVRAVNTDEIESLDSTEVSARALDLSPPSHPSGLIIKKNK